MSLLFAFILISQQLYDMDEVVVTASRYPALLKDVAVAVMVIERDQIEEQSALGLVEILNNNAGVDLKDYGTPGGVTSLSLRGIPSNGTLVLVDGQPLNTITNSMADLAAVDINAIERIEIVKGPVASYYGANALGGVVNIITQRRIEEPDVAVQFTPSSGSLDDPFNATDVSARAGIPVHDAQIDIAGLHKRSAGLRSNSDLSQYSGSAAIAFSGKQFTLGSSLLYSDKEYGVPGPMPLVDSTHPAPVFGDSTATSIFDRERDRVLMANMKVEWQATDHITCHAKFLADRKRTVYTTTYGSWSADTITDEYDYLTRMLGSNTMVTAQWPRTKFTVGLDLRHDTLETRVASTQSADTSWHGASRNVGVWTEIGLRFVPEVSASSSIRYDHNSSFGSFWSPGFGIVAMPAENIALKLSAGKTYRAPGFNDLYWPQSGNPDLNPEHGWAYEIRCESSLRPGLFAALSLFRREVRDRIAWLPGDDGMWHPENINQQLNMGLDFELNYSMRDILEYRFEFTYLHARQRSDEIAYDFYDWIADTSLVITEEVERAAAFTPRYSASSSVNIKLPRGFKFNIAAQYASDRLNYYANYDAYPYVSMDTKTLDAYFVMNAALSKEIGRYVRLTIGMKNLFDAHYCLQFGNTIADLDYPMPGRTYFLRLGVQTGQR